MKKKFKLTDLDCANCAAKMEDAIKKLDGVNDASVSFMMQKMTIDADDARSVFQKEIRPLRQSRASAFRSERARSSE